jgi:hypothetical protein
LEEGSSGRVGFTASGAAFTFAGGFKKDPASGSPGEIEQIAKVAIADATKLSAKETIRGISRGAVRSVILNYAAIGEPMGQFH